VSGLQDCFGINAQPFQRMSHKACLTAGFMLAENIGFFCCNDIYRSKIPNLSIDTSKDNIESAKEMFEKIIFLRLKDYPALCGLAYIYDLNVMENMRKV
jgi:hypothetical protein